MNLRSRQAAWLRDELLHLLSLSGNLAGLCITGVTLLHTIGKTSITATVTDDALALAAFLFLVCTYFIFIALRSSRQELSTRLETLIDLLFEFALTVMVAAGFLMLYTVW